MGKTVWIMMMLVLVPSGFAEFKIWLPTTSLLYPENWVGQKLPEPCDGLPLKNALDLTVRYPATLTGSAVSIVLPRQGVLALGENSALNFIDPRKCSGYKPQAEFIRTTAKAWLDPDNWLARNSLISEGWAPHRNRIPCAGDMIAFVDRLNVTLTASLTVMLPSVLVPVEYIFVSNQTFTTSEWSGYLQTEKGSEYFKGPADIRALKWRTSNKCANEKMCFCGRGAYVIRDWSYITVESNVLDEAVCMYARPKCEQIEINCHSPVYPDGHCCGVCGAIVHIHDQTEEGINLTSIARIVRHVLKDSGLKSKFNVGRLSNGDIQITILSKNGDSTESYELANAISLRLHNEHIGAFSVSLLSSGWSKEFNPVSSMLGTFFGPLFFVIFLFGFIYTLIVVLPKQKWLQLNKRDPFTFARFQNNLQEAMGDDTLALTTGRPASESFSNPLYNTEKIEQQPFADSERKTDDFPSKDDSEKLIQLAELKAKPDMEEAACVVFPDMQPGDEYESDESDGDSEPPKY